ncbi:MAG: peptidoglycan endopeptidase [Thermoleophilaceae bacterium]
MTAACLLVMGLAGTASAAGRPSSGGATFEPPPPPPTAAKIVDGQAIAPASAPGRVKRVIEAGNRLIGKPYRYGGGHRPFGRMLDTGYDCSGTASYALYGGRFLRSPMPSGSFMNWAQDGPGRWITVYAHGGHMYLVVAGLRLDTGMRDDPSTTGPAWSKRLRPSNAFVARHPSGY